MSRAGRVYVGNLKDGVTEDQLQGLFGKHGRVSRIDVKKGFAFVEFEEANSADEAIRALDSQEFEGSRLRVEASRGRREGDGGRYDRYLNDRSRAPMRSDYRVVVENLSPNTSWQELKDHMRQAGDVVFADVIRGGDGRSKGHGVVEYRTLEDMKRAIRDLHGSRLEGQSVVVEEDRDSAPRDSARGSRDYDRDGRGSRDYDRDGRGYRDSDRGRKRSRSPEPRRRSRSRSRSRSVSPVRSRRRSSVSPPSRRDNRSPSPRKH